MEAGRGSRRLRQRWRMARLCGRCLLEGTREGGQPLPLAWRRGRFRARLLDGAEPELWGWIAEPFGFYRGDATGPGRPGCKTYTLTYLPELRMLGTLRLARECKALAADLARQWIRAEKL